MNHLSIESDVFVGRRKSIRRYLICSLQGFFPVLVKTGPQGLACIYRVGGVHVGISGTLAVSTSRDSGVSWSDPARVTPGYEDSRNPAFGVTDEGELIAAFWKARYDRYSETPRGLEWDREKISGDAITTCVSIGNSAGDTWTDMAPYRSEMLSFVSPYGRIVRSPDGTLLMPAYGARRTPIEGVRDTAVIIRSTDNGRSWGNESLVADSLNEFSLCYNAEGTLIAAARGEHGAVSVLMSTDDGMTFSEPRQVTREREIPADLVLLQSGKLLLTFGRRVRPYGCGALISSDGGETWDTDREVLLAGDGAKNTDLGYPSTVQLDDGSIITALYYASGSQASDGQYHGWGDISCQALVYDESLFE